MLLDATNPRELPHLHRMWLIYEWAPGGRGIYPDADRSKVWTADQVRKELSFAESSLILIDDESKVLSDVWWPNVTEETLESRRDHIAQILDTFTDVDPTRLVGLYGLGQPFYSLHDIENRRAEAEEDAIRLSYDHRPGSGFHHRGLIDRVHYLCPVLYTRGVGTDTFEGWRKRSEITVRFMRRWHKPIIALMWPLHHDDHVRPELRKQPIDLDQWEQMIQWCKDECDHTAIWNGQNFFGKIPETHKAVLK